MVPTIFGITLVTFILINLAIDNPDATVGEGGLGAMDQETAQDLRRGFGLHLPMFLNLSIKDIRTRTKEDIELLKDPAKQNAAKRSIILRGAAGLPYLLPVLSKLQPKEKTALLEALESIASTIELKEPLSASNNKASFWESYFATYGSDFTPIRASRLVRRYSRRNDKLALAQLKRLGSYSLPQLMDALDSDISFEAEQRIVKLLCKFTNRTDFLKDKSDEKRSQLKSRWQEWWYQRYDLYTSFEGIDRLVGAITETRYFRWIARVATFDFGVSLRDGIPIHEKITNRLPVTLPSTRNSHLNG